MLRLHGTPREMGYAHGFLLAAEILEGFESYIVYLARRRRPEELRGPHRSQGAEGDGVPARARGRARRACSKESAPRSATSAGVPALDRPIELIDLKVLNTYGDWYQFACSSFSAWGKLTPDGETITARNFDFFPTPILEKAQLLDRVLAFRPGAQALGQRRRSRGCSA